MVRGSYAYLDPNYQWQQVHKYFLQKYEIFLPRLFVQVEYVADSAGFHVAGPVSHPADTAAVSAALDKAIASVPSSQVRDVHNSFAKLVSGSVSNKLSSTVNPAEAVQACDGLITVTDTVKAARR